MSAELVVTVKQGDLRGVVTESILGGSYISFKGIPYASPPVGDLRLRDPHPAPPWTGIRDAFEEGPRCAQFDVFTKEIVGDDDCLYLNVSTTSLTGSRPVMVWIHPGAFIYGDGGYAMSSPDYLMEMDVVYVSMNYRLGVLGFLHLDHEAAPGNLGLKDQVAALKWVKENICQFGGDPNNVTIFGGSAGGACVHYLLISPLAKGLFHKAISQSAASLNPFASSTEMLSIAHRYAAAVGNDSTDPNKIVEYLRNVPVHKLIEVQTSLLIPEDGTDVMFPFGPCVDDKSVEPVMPKPVRELATQGFDVPIIIGYNSHEGLIFSNNVYFSAEIHEKMWERLYGDFEAMVPRYLAEKAPTKVAEMAREMKNFYFGDKQVTKDLVDEYVQCYGDLYFVLGIHEIVEAQSEKKSPTYFYRFSYDSPNSIAKTLTQLKGKGAAHTEELFYLFHSTLIPEDLKFKPGSTEEIVRKRLVRLWTNFAKNGNPTPVIDDLITVKWEPVAETSKNYLEIDAQISVGVNLRQEMWDTWQRVYAIAGDQ